MVNNKLNVFWFYGKNKINILSNHLFIDGLDVYNMHADFCRVIKQKRKKFYYLPIYSEILLLKNINIPIIRRNLKYISWKIENTKAKNINISLDMLEFKKFKNNCTHMNINNKVNFISCVITLISKSIFTIKSKLKNLSIGFPIPFSSNKRFNNIGGVFITVGRNILSVSNEEACININNQIKKREKDPINSYLIFNVYKINLIY